MTPALAHFLLTSAAWLGLFLLLSSRKWWASSVALLALNFLGFLVYQATDHITGAGFNEAAVYHVLNAWTDVHLLWTFPNFRQLAMSLVLLLLVTVGLSRLRPRGLVKLPGVLQALMVISVGLSSLYTTPLVADVKYAVLGEGLNVSDQIGLDTVLSRVTPLPPGPYPRHKNLILVYAESLEQGLFDDQVFPGLMEKTNQLIASGMHFRNVSQAPMSSWTIAGMIASQCGVPLSTQRLVQEGSAKGQPSHSFNCLAQYLASQNYHQVYMGGASNRFAGKGNYYRSMKFDEVLGLDELRTATSPTSEWGLHDDELFGLVKGKVQSLRAKEQPFALIFLTLDTHAPKGYDTPTCQRQNIRWGDGQNEALNRVHCADMLLSTLIGDLIRENLHDTSIVLLSDHLMMGGDVNDELVKRHADRKMHMVIWDKDLGPGVTKRASNHFDLGPTMLQVMIGEPFRIGFGSSLLAEGTTLTAEHGDQRVQDSVQSWRSSAWAH